MKYIIASIIVMSIAGCATKNGFKNPFECFQFNDPKPVVLESKHENVPVISDAIVVGENQ